MGSMGILKNQLVLPRVKFKAFLCLQLGGILIVSNAFAFDWRVRPNLTMSEMFSDNLNLSDNAKKSGFVTQVAPGLSLYGSSPWSSLNLNYRLQGLYNAGGSDAVDINHQLQMNSLYQAVRNTLFLETSSSISQQNLSNAFIATDNLSGSGSRSEVKTFSISPYWTPHFGRYANGLFKVGYDSATFDNGADNVQNSPISQSLISDSDSYSKQANLSSGSYFNRVNWGLNYSSQDNSRASGNDVNFESYSANSRYYIDRKFNVFAQGGYENNDFQSVTNSSNNGFFYTLGGQWSPSQWYSVEAGYGNNKHVTVQYNPSANFSSTVTYRNREIGLNTGNTWDANINYRIQQAVVGFKFFQDTTTVQQELIRQGLRTSQGFLLLNSDQITQLTDQGLGSFITSLSSLVDDVIVRKRGDLTFAYQTGKSSFNASLYNERRTFQLSAQEETVYGASGGWQWQFEPRLNFFLRPLWQSTDGANGNSRYDVVMGLSRSVPINLGRPLSMNTNFELRHIEQVSDNLGFDYIENRATANFTVQF